MDSDKLNGRRVEIVETETVEEINPTESRGTAGTRGAERASTESERRPAEFGATPNPIAERAMVEKEEGGGLPNMGPESVPSSGMERAATDPTGSSDWDESNP